MKCDHTGTSETYAIYIKLWNITVVYNFFFAATQSGAV